MFDAAALPDARDTAHPCRPTVSCTADLSAPGSLEVEAGGLFTRADPRNSVWSLPFLVKQTFTPLFQLQVGSNGYTASRGDAPARYFDNVYVGPKLHLVDQGAIMPSLAITALASFPMPEQDGYARHDDAFFTGHASKDVGVVHGDFNAGVYLWQLESSPLAQGFTALALSTSLPPPFGVALEGYVFSDAPPVAPRDGGVRGAVSLTPRPWLIFDFGGDIGFYPSTRAFSLFGGMTIIPVVFGRSS
jgi:hypothetical protein